MALIKPCELLEPPKTSCATTQLVTVNVMAQKDRRMNQWEISSQASRKRDEGSTTKKSSLSLFGRAKFSRAQGLFSRFFVRTSAFFAGMVKANVISFLDHFKVFESIIRLVPIYMMNKFIGLQKSAEMIFHDYTMFSHISSLISKRMIRPADHNIAIVSKNLAGMEFVSNGKSMDSASFGNCRRSEVKNLRNFWGRKPLSGQLFYSCDRDDSASSLNPEFVHVIHDALLADTILFGNFGGRVKSFVVFLKHGFGKGYVKFSSSLHEITSFAILGIISPSLFISQGKRMI